MTDAKDMDGFIRCPWLALKRDIKGMERVKVRDVPGLLDLLREWACLVIFVTYWVSFDVYAYNEIKLGAISLAPDITCLCEPKSDPFAAISDHNSEVTHFSATLRQGTFWITQFRMLKVYLHRNHERRWDAATPSYTNPDLTIAVRVLTTHANGCLLLMAHLSPAIHTAFSLQEIFTVIKHIWIKREQSTTVAAADLLVVMQSFTPFMEQEASLSCSWDPINGL